MGSGMEQMPGYRLPSTLRHQRQLTPAVVTSINTGVTYGFGEVRVATLALLTRTALSDSGPAALAFGLCGDPSSTVCRHGVIRSHFRCTNRSFEPTLAAWT
jgi:hypothetical protein